MTPVSCKDCPPPTDGHPVLFYYSAGYARVGSGWRIGWMLGDGWIVAHVRDYKPLPLERVTHWCELPARPSDSCACQFIERKPCPVCLLTIEEFEAEFYSAHVSEGQ